MSNPKSVPIVCATCGQPSLTPQLRSCKNCYEVEGRLALYLESPAGLQFVRERLVEAEEDENLLLISQIQAMARLKIFKAVHLVALIQMVNEKITEDMLDFAGPSGTLHIPLSRAEIEALRAALAGAGGGISG